MIPFDAEVKSIAALYGIEIQSIVPVSGGFSGACIFKVEDGSGAAFAVRRTPAADFMPEQRYCELVALLRDVSSRGCACIPVPMRHGQSSPGILATAQMERFANVDQSQTRIRIHKSVWQIEPWMPGQPVLGLPTSCQLASAIETLALFHKTAAESVLTRAINQTLRVAWEHSPGISRRLSVAVELSGGLLARFHKAAANGSDPEFRSCSKRLCVALDQWLPWLTKQLTEIASVSYQLQPVIRDLWRPHVLFTEGRVTGIIDLNAIATDHVGLDVTRLLRSWYGADIERIRQVISLFVDQRLFNENERCLLRTLDASTVLLSPVRWLRDYVEGHLGERQAVSVLARFRDLTSIAEQFEPL